MFYGYELENNIENHLKQYNIFITNKERTKKTLNLEIFIDNYYNPSLYDRKINKNESFAIATFLIKEVLASNYKGWLSLVMRLENGKERVTLINMKDAKKTNFSIYYNFDKQLKVNQIIEKFAI